MLIKRLLLLIGFSCGFVVNIAAQSNVQTSQRTLYLELGGNGGIGSFNYEILHTKTTKLKHGWRFGLSLFPIDRNNGLALLFPVSYHAVYGENRHKVDLSFGQTLTVTTKGSLHALAVPAVGYRFDDGAKAFFRASYTPLVSYLLDFQYQHYIGLSAGIYLKPKR